MDVEKLRHITRILLDRTRPAYTLRNEVLELRSIFENAGGFKAEATDIALGETITETGVAISPTMAAMCLDDFARTVQFIRGTHAAILDLKNKNSPVRVLYAGCGPWGTLAVPLMSVFDAGEVRCTLVDIHAESIDSVERIIRKLGLEDRIEDLETADANAYLVKKPIDLILVEMLRSALRSEPQVAVTRHLRAQAAGAVIIPERVQIDLALIDSSREFSTERDRIILGTVYSFDENTDPLVITLPDFDVARYSPMLLTSVQVYGEFALSDYDSGITLPGTVGNVGPGQTVEFVYETSVNPGLRVHVIETESPR
jgi:hypothetical protein